jgi:predicted lactoylglutathione lyase
MQTAGIIYHVTDLSATAAFYESIGFRIDYRSADKVVAYVGAFWFEFLPGQSGAPGIALAIKVGDVDAFYARVKDLGLKPATAPVTHPWGRRAFMLQDPDGYHLEFYNEAA